MTNKIDNLLYSIFGIEYQTKIHGELFNIFHNILYQCGLELLYYNKPSRNGHFVLNELFGKEYIQKVREFFNNDIQGHQFATYPEMIDTWCNLPTTDFYNYVNKIRINGFSNKSNPITTKT